MAASVTLAFGSHGGSESASPSGVSTPPAETHAAVLVDGGRRYRTRVLEALALLEARCPLAHATFIDQVNVIANEPCRARGRGCRCDVFVISPETAAASPPWLAGVIAREGYVRAARAGEMGEWRIAIDACASDRIEQAGEVVRVAVLLALRASPSEIEWASQMASPTGLDRRVDRFGRN